MHLLYSKFSFSLLKDYGLATAGTAPAPLCKRHNFEISIYQRLCKSSFLSQLNVTSAALIIQIL